LFFAFLVVDDDYGRNYSEVEACSIKKSKTGSIFLTP